MSLRTATLAALLLLPLPGRLAACAFHTEFLEPAVSRQIADATLVVAARPAAHNPFRFEPVAVLSRAASAGAPPHLVDSGTRLRLTRNPGEAVLFVRQRDGSWTRLLLLDAATRPLVERMIARTGAATSPEAAAEWRDALAALLDHPDDAVRRLALRELDALPYGLLRGGTYPVEAADLLRGIANIQDMPLAPIHILLLGLDGGRAADAAIANRLARLTASGADLHLGAWIMAALESGGPVGVARVECLTLGAADRLTEAQLIQLVGALSGQSASGDPALRSAIDGMIRRLVFLRPDATPFVAQALGSNADYSQAGLVRELIAARAFTDRAGLMAATAYLTQARNSGRAGGAGTSPGQIARPEW